MIYLVLLFIKHYLIDFVFQTNEMVKGKAIYGNVEGIMHSAEHGILTMWITIMFTLSIPLALIMGLVDGVLHYHIDWTKMNYGNRDITNPLFWNHLGLDQLAHAICYVCYASVILGI